MESLSVTARNRRALWSTFGLTFSFFLIATVGGFLTNSLALLADAAHMLTDVGGLGLALFAAWMSARPATPAKTYGYYRIEILAAMVNAGVLFFISFWILYEAYGRFQEPTEVASVPMMAIAILGLIVNLLGIWYLRAGAKESLNVQGAFLEVVSDMLGSLGAIIAGMIIWLTGWRYADPLFSVAIGLFVLPRTWNLMSQAVNVLLEGVPPRINIAAVEEAIRDVDGVAGVNDLHIWTLTSGFDALSAHVVLDEGVERWATDMLLGKLSELLNDDFGIDHTTIQLEAPGRAEDEMRI